jgi:uncharacterized protein
MLQRQGGRSKRCLPMPGRGLGKGFLDQDFQEVQGVVDTNISGTIHLIQKVGHLPNAGRDRDRVVRRHAYSL